MLIPEEGAVGAAKAALITQIIVAVAHAVAAFRLLNRKVQDYSPSH